MHNTLHLDRATRPRDASATLRHVQYLLGGLMATMTLLAAGWRRPLAGPYLALFLGALVVVMLLLCPVCHLHYFSMMLPLVMGLVAASWRDRFNDRIAISLVALLWINAIGNGIPNLPGLELARDVGVAMYATLALWIVALVVLWRRPASEEPHAKSLVNSWCGPSGQELSSTGSPQIAAWVQTGNPCPSRVG
ncbi:MAG: hypothetical protein K2R98_10915 [Gemmataceae bacterium]|nr:hypothetical protein [Gemmataceae bacterium]